MFDHRLCCPPRYFAVRDARSELTEPAAAGGTRSELAEAAAAGDDTAESGSLARVYDTSPMCDSAAAQACDASAAWACDASPAGARDAPAAVPPERVNGEPATLAPAGVSADAAETTGTPGGSLRTSSSGARPVMSGSGFEDSVVTAFLVIEQMR